MARPRSKDPRIRRRNEAARVVKTPEGLELTRRPDDAPAGDAMRAAVLAAFLMGKSSRQIAQQYNLSITTVKKWEESFDISNPIRRRDQLSEDVLTFVREEIESLIAISITTRDEEWLLSQPASELAQFVAVKEDRLMAILAAYGRVQESRPQFEIVQDSE